MAKLSQVLGGMGTRELAIDLGTANTLVYVKGHGIVLDEPSVVAINLNTGRPIAVGTEAKRMIGRTPAHIATIRPLKDGVIADFEVCEEMLRYFVHKINPSRFLTRHRTVICVPSGITRVEHRAVRDAAEFAGARQAVVIEEPMAAAIGAGLPINQAIGSMIVDIGGGTTEVAVISLGSIVASRSARIGGNDLDAAIMTYIKKEYSLALGERTAEAIKIRMGSAHPLPDEFDAEVRGRDLVTGLPKSIVTTTEEIREGLDEPVTAIIDAVKVTLDECPPELAADIMDRGIVLAGGGALLGGMVERLQHETGMPIRIADDPLQCVVLGSGRYLELTSSPERTGGKRTGQRRAARRADADARTLGVPSSA
ncbi:MAG: rod shape-determining protein [Acidimicrobiia bacterium]|nr:rod shape-determining protein [Acidimicrobiia bacterium]